MSQRKNNRLIECWSVRFKATYQEDFAVKLICCYLHPKSHNAF